MGLREWWENFAFNESEDYSYFEIDDDHVISTHSASAEDFIPMRTYFELRLKQMFLKNQRVYTREFEPVAHVAVDFQFAGERIQSPIIVGPSMLANVDKVSKGDQIEFLNIRIVGPCPYEGEDLKVFTGLFRMVTKDWTKRVLSLLETFSQTFDSSHISSFINISKPLSDGIQGFIGLEDIEMRVGRYIQYAAPDMNSTGFGVLRPCFAVHLRKPSSEVVKERFWVNEGRLHYGDSREELTEYDGADFMLLELAPLATRGDYTGFDFHRKHWKKIESLLAEQKNDDAFATFKLLAAELVTCDDIILPHRASLLKNYREQMDEWIKFYDELYSTDRPGRQPITAETQPRIKELDEKDLQKALEQDIEAETDVEYTPESILSKYTK
ncbi:MAG: hypothetical protein ACLFVP_00030 [Candidatus Bathyarchaeia archaeon]